MGTIKSELDSSKIVQSLVYTLLRVFDETRDLVYTLRKKEQKDYERSLRTKGYPESRRIKHVDDDGSSSDQVIATDKAAVTRQFEVGYRELGSQFAEGDVFSQTALQSQIIMLQSTMIITFLYGPTSSEPIGHQLSRLTAASRAAGTTSVEVLAAQLQRQRTVVTATSQACQTQAASAPRDMDCDIRSSTASNSMVIYQKPRPSSPVNTTILEWRGKPKLERTDTDTTSMTGPTSYGMKSAPHDLYCLYAIDLQRHRDQALSSSITSDPLPYCPHCKRDLHLSPGKAWEVCKEDDGFERIFQISNRFVVKCHRDGADGQYSCVLCSAHADVVSVCGDVKALIKHIWEEHNIAQLKNEEDITEVVDLPMDRRRDSGLGSSASRSSRRSASLGPSQRWSKPGVEREVDIFEFRAPRRGP